MNPKEKKSRWKAPWRNLRDRWKYGRVLPHDRASLHLLLQDAEQRSLIPPGILPMLRGALDMSELKVRDIMLPRTQMVVVRDDAEPGELIRIALESGHSRLPVVQGNTDNVVGVLLSKDLLNYSTQGKKEEFRLDEILRPPYFVPESKRLHNLLREFRKHRSHLAVVINEYDGIAGLITIEDIIEVIVGTIEDEHDLVEDRKILRHNDRRFSVLAITPIAEFNSYFHTDFSDEKYDTVGGLILQAFGRLPIRGESIEISDFKAKVLRVDERRIQVVRLIWKKNPRPGS